LTTGRHGGAGREGVRIIGAEGLLHRGWKTRRPAAAERGLAPAPASMAPSRSHAPPLLEGRDIISARGGAPAEQRRRVSTPTGAQANRRGLDSREPPCPARTQRITTSPSALCRIESYSPRLSVAADLDPESRAWRPAAGHIAGVDCRVNELQPQPDGGRSAAPPVSTQTRCRVRASGHSFGDALGRVPIRPCASDEAAGAHPRRPARPGRTKGLRSRLVGRLQGCRIRLGLAEPQNRRERAGPGGVWPARIPRSGNGGGFWSSSGMIRVSAMRHAGGTAGDRL